MPAPHQKNKLHPQDQKNLMIFAIAFGIVYLLFDAFILRPHLENINAYNDQQAQKTTEIEKKIRPPEFLPRKEVLVSDRRIPFNHESLSGFVNLRGGRIDDVNLNAYFETLEKDEKVSVASPPNTAFPRYIDFGWLNAPDQKLDLPDRNTQWQVASRSDNHITLFWENNTGLRFERHITVTDTFLIKVIQRIINNSTSTHILFPYTSITEHGLPNQLKHRWIIHEGPIGFINDRLEERKYSDMPGTPEETIDAKTGWIGFTEQYWLTAILPEQETEKTFRYAYAAPNNNESSKGKYQVDVLSNGQTIASGNTIEHTTHVFTGAKEFNLLKEYSRDLNVKGFDAAIDWGWFWFLTKPFFTILLMINGVVGYFAVTMLLFALLLRLLIFPMANTSYRSFAKLRIIAPRIKELKDQYNDDKAGMQKALMELYQKEKVNPAAGCLPILIQIPIFFSLFKVLNVAIEMRHAPGFFWIDDLSAPDPTSLFNLFGLLPYDVPQFLMIGAWPCLMILTLQLQRSMNPPPTDPVIRDMFRYMPYFMGFIMSGFAAGLVIYWTFSNFLSGIQQYTIMRMMGVEVKFFQGWFGRETQQNMPDARKLGFSEDMLSPKKEDVEDALENEAEKEVEQEAQKEITPPKPKKKKKKK